MSIESPPAAPLIAPMEAARAWEIVLQRIEGDLLSGALKPGDHLPAERTLASELGVGRSSVREALRVLEVLGLIRTSTGSGPQSGAIIIARPTGGMSALVRLQVAAHGFAVRDVVKTRLVLEAAVVAELAEASDPDLTAALELLDAMEQTDAPHESRTPVPPLPVVPSVAPGAALPLTRDEYLTLDQAFHLALAVASGNEVIASMMAGLRDSIEKYVRVGASFLPSWEETATRLKAEHRGIVAAIQAHDPELARTRIRQHIETYHAETNVSSIHPH